MGNRYLYKSILKFCVSVMMMVFVFGSMLHAQETSNENKKIEGADAVREEIQRYMGYEPLFPRYLTLPYDATTNSNVHAPHVDIGYLFMALIPIIFLFGFRKKPLQGILYMFMLLGLLYVSIGSGKVVHNNNLIDTIALPNTPDNDSPTLFPSGIIKPVYNAVGKSYPSVNNFFQNVSGDADGFTYPFLFLMFGLLLFIIKQRSNDDNETKQIFILFISFFTFMWMLLTAGIIWYGYPMIALSLLLILSSLSSKKNVESPSWIKNSKTIIVLGSIAVFINLSLVRRMSNYQPKQNADIAKFMFDDGELKYQAGRQKKSDVLNGFFPGGFSQSIKKINRNEEEYVYSVGTVLPFFVKKNDKRVFKDNQLQNFERLRVHYKDKNTLVKVLKSGGFKYIFVDLLTYSIDKTPERTLENKYKEFMRVLYQNPKVKLLATNRRINTSDDPERPKQEYGVFGTLIPGFHGTYAIFELLD